MERNEMNEFVQEIISAILACVEVNQHYADQLMNKEELARKLKCDSAVVYQKYISKPGFPKMVVGQNNQLRFSHKAVDKWIQENQSYQ